MLTESIEEKKLYDPADVDDDELIDDHDLMHEGWTYLKTNPKWGTWNKEEVWNTHARIVAEMKKRDLEHDIVDPSLDSVKFEEVLKLPLSDRTKQLIQNLDSFVVSPGFISLVGSCAEKKEDANDIDFVIKLKKKNDAIEQRLIQQPGLEAAIPDVHFIYDTNGSHGDHLELYDLVAVRRSTPMIQKVAYSFPMFGAAPQNARLKIHPGIMMAFLHRQLDRAEILDQDGNRIPDFPLIEQEAAQMQKPDTFILCGYLSSDGRFFAKDIHRWSTTELLQSPEHDRQFFLDKFQWTGNILRPVEKSDHLEFEEKVTLMKAFLPLKVRAGYGAYEFNDINKLIKFWAAGENLKTGIAVQEKADGFRLVFHKKGNAVRAFTEDKRRDRADMLPAITNEIKKLKPDELILDTEVVMYDSAGKLMPRHESMAIIAAKTPLTQVIKANVHDVLWYNEAKNDAPYSERIALARKAVPKDTKHLRVMPTMIAHTEDQLRKFVQRAAKTPGSEGAMLKVIDSAYPLKGRTPLWAKLKMVKEITLKVIGIRRKRVGGKPVETFLYRGAFTKDGKLEAMYSQHTLGPKDMKEESEWEMSQGFKPGRVGDYGYAETYASNIKAKPGDLITVSPIHILKFKGKDDKERFAFMFPRLRNLETAKTKPDTIEDLERIAALGKGTEKMKLEDLLNIIDPMDFPITIKEV